jgi:hypothetical protein
LLLHLLLSLHILMILLDPDELSRLRLLVSNLVCHLEGNFWKSNLNARD